MNRKDEESSVFLNFLAGIGLGAVIGAATALLLAPKAGAETREDLKTAVDELRNRANKVAADWSTTTDELMQKSRELLDTTRNRIQNAVESGRQAMKQTQEDMADESQGEQESQA